MTLTTQKPLHRRPAPDYITAGVGIALAVGLGAIMLTSPATYGSSTGGYGATVSIASAYARPTPALDGETLAVYIAEHQSSRLGAVTP
jgi:hypothetical protein